MAAMRVHNETLFRYSYVAGTVDRPNDVLTLVVKGTFGTRHGEPAKPLPRPRQERPTMRLSYPDGPTRSVCYPGDFATFKPLGDAVAVGTCHTPGGRPMGRCDVAFTLGNRRKVLAVFGDRYWVEREDGVHTMTEPEPFTAMPLRHENAFGSADYIRNPLGKGRYNVWDLYPDGRIPLPNVEDPDHPIRTIDDAPPVAGFAPIGARSVERQEKLGAMDLAWARREAPRKPVDFDWTSYNAAPEDQQVDGFFRGDEVLSFENMHPEHSPYRVVLPGLRVRLFLNRREPDGTVTFFEPPANLDTVWVNLDEERLIQVWRAVTPVSRRGHPELTEALIVQERLEDPPLPLEHYRALLAGRMQPPAPPWLEEERRDAAAAFAAAKAELDGVGLPDAAVAELRAEEDPRRFLELFGRHMMERMGRKPPPASPGDA